jgi:hypothetical protein
MVGLSWLARCEVVQDSRPPDVGVGEAPVGGPREDAEIDEPLDEGLLHPRPRRDVDLPQAGMVASRR